MAELRRTSIRPSDVSPRGDSFRRIGERVGLAAGSADYQADQGGSGHAQQDEEEQADTQRGELREESDGRRSHQEAEIAEATHGGNASGFADLRDASAGSEGQRD